MQKKMAQSEMDPHGKTELNFSLTDTFKGTSSLKEIQYSAKQGKLVLALQCHLQKRLNEKIKAME
jgi:hypothetical protein